MSKYLNVFNTLAEYQAFSASTEYVQPNVALVKETNVLYYDYGDNKPQVDMSNYKGEFQESSVGGDKYGKDAITKINYIASGVTMLHSTFQHFTGLEEVTCEIPDTVTNMYWTFHDCSSLVNAPEIPNSVTSMERAFYGCSSLVNVPNLPSGVTNIRYTFNDCTSLVNVPNIPDSVSSLYSTFSGCTSLVNAPVIPSSVTDMNYTFMNCSSLVNVPVIPSSVIYMSYTFRGCSSLVNAPEIPSGVTILSNTFYGCSSLVNATIPSGVTSMPDTFYYCKSLKEVTLLPVTPPSYSYPFWGCKNLESIYVPDSALEDYKNATGWAEFEVTDKFKPLSSKQSE